MTQKRVGRIPFRDDWHAADIVASLRRIGWSLRRLSRHHGYKNPSQLSNVLQRRWPKGERIIAETVGVHPADIWPSRYTDKDSTRARKRP